jgi:tetratricopeptide (TPR) repeat protein
MKIITKRYTFLLFATLLLILIGGLNASAQYSKVDLNKLKKKYTWGSIYFAYDPICDFMYDLKDKSKAPAFSRISSNEIVNLLSNFFKSNMAKDRKSSIAFLQINLEIKQVGFIKGDDHNGVITILQWGDEEVKQIADLCDHILTGRVAFNELLDKLKSKDISVAEAWDQIWKIRRNIFVPAERSTLLLFSYRSLINQRADELDRLKTADRALYDSINKFKANFDSMHKQKNHFPETFLDNYYDNLFEPSSDDNPFQKYLTLMNDEIESQDNKEELLVAARTPASGEGQLVVSTASGGRETEMDTATALQDTLEYARQLYLTGQYPDALLVLRRILTSDPMNAEAELLSGRIFERLNDQAQAIDALKKALSLNPQLIDAHILLGRVYLRLGDRSKAFKYTQQALGLDPYNEQAIELQRRFEESSAAASP